MSQSRIDYLAQLVDWAGGRDSFCRRTGVRPPNLSAYLAGSKAISWARLRRATTSIFSVEPPAFTPILEFHDLKSKGLPKAAQLGHQSGVYAFLDSAMRVIYFGKAKNLYTEVRQTLDRAVGDVKRLDSRDEMTFRDVTIFLSAYAIHRGDEHFRHDLEALFLRVIRNTTFNKNVGVFKRNE